MKKIIFFLIEDYLRMTEINNNKRLHIPDKNIENEILKEKFKKTYLLIKEITNKRSNDFQKSIKKFKNDENYEFKKIFGERHFLFRAIQEINEEITKNEEGFLIDLGDMIRDFFDE